MEIEVDEHEQVLERVAGIDVAKASGMVCTRTPAETGTGRRVTKVWEVKTTTRALLELADHLRAQGIQRIVLESTSDYWRPFYYLLEAAGLTVWLVNAAQVKNVPGRPKTDKIDAVWLAKLAEKSMVSASFVPAEPIRHVRDLARARFDLVEDRTRVKQRVEKLLEDALIKISAVLTDIHGVSGRVIIEALIAGQRNPKVLAELAKGRARARRAELEAACDGRFTDHHARLAKMLLSQIDDLGARIEEVTALLDEAIAALPAPAPAPADSTTAGTVNAAALDTGPTGYASAVKRLCQIPGGGPDSVRAVIGEIGLDMTVFGTPQRLCSWAKTSPRTVESGRKKGRARTGKGNPYLKAALGQMATGAAKTDTFLGERYRRLIRRMPKAKALAALERSILVIIFHLLADPAAEFADLGADFYTRRIDKARRTSHLTRQLQALGYTVALTPAA
ncbi:IS110 family transposase [Geodermatophilus sp. TF02-6]|nr:IS110 family transposase [Geodermatophilus sp. TF02-6]